MKAVARAMKEEAVRKINEIFMNLNNVFRLVRKMKMESTDVVRGMFMRGNDETLYLNEKDKAKLKNKLDQIADTVRDHLQE